MEILNSNFNDIQHIGIPVTDLARSKSFYERLGFNDVMSRSFPCNGQTGHASMMKRGRAIMELFQLPESELDKVRGLKDGHINHVTFDVSDIDKAFCELKDAGFDVVEEEPVNLDFWEKGCKYFNILGPDGERLEFNQIL